MEGHVKQKLLLSLALSIFSAGFALADCQPALRYIIAQRLNNFSYLERIVPNYSFLKEIVLKSEHRAAVVKEAKKLGIEIPSELQGITDMLNHVAIQLQKKDSNRTNAAENMANFGEQIRNKIGLSKVEDIASFDAALGLATLRLEGFKKSEYEIDQGFILAQGAKNEIRPSEYWEWVQSYISNTGKYKDSNPNRGVIGAAEYRDITSHNHWPVYLKDHDIRHIHYALSHPKAMAVLLTSMRSTNHKRSALLSAIFEGVDHVQFGYESRLAKYMSTQRGMTLEQAMLHIAKASNGELNRIIEEAKIKEDINDVVNELNGWKPKLGGEFSELGPKEKKYELEVDEMLESFHRFSKEGSEMDRRTLEYTQNPKSETGPITPESSDAIRFNDYGY